MEKYHDEFDLTYTQNRELSWLQFNARVLEEAEDPEVPLLERLRFISIFTSNLNEFFMVRVGSLLDLSIMAPGEAENKSGKTPKEQIALVLKAAGPLIHRRDSAYMQVMAELDKAGITEVTYSKLKSKEEVYANSYFNENIRPLLSPQVIDRSHPFPHLKNLSLYVAVLLKSSNKILLGIVEVPDSVPAVIPLPSDLGYRFIRTEELVSGNINKIFKIYSIQDKAVVSVTRNADISFDEDKFDEDNPDYRDRMAKLLKRRNRLSPVRLMVQGNEPELGKMLSKELRLGKNHVYCCKAPLSLSWAYHIGCERQDLLYKKHEPRWPGYIEPDIPMKTQIRQRDLLLFYPYHTMKPFLQLLKEAANDKNVMSISITLYRLAKNSRVVKYLSEAAENGKDVTVLVELRARFDEKNNIEWAQILEEAGCRVLYGLEGFKCHSKICHITYRTKNGISHITQIGTGNYNENTAGLYTDFCLMTADTETGRNAAEFFSNMLIGNIYESYTRLLIAPKDMKASLLRLIDSEISKGNDGRILIKTNSVTERSLIDKLSEASRAGVKIDLIVRGICCILPGIPGKTDNIRVTSIVGRFLEHSRIYSFGQGALQQIFISSADIMTRNQERRVEIACPVMSAEHKKWFSDYLDLLLADNVKARLLTPFGSYVRKNGNTEKLDVQRYFIDHEIDFAGTIRPKQSLVERIKGFAGRFRA